MKAIPNNKTFAAAYLMRSKILYVQISRIMAHYGLRRAPVIQSPSRTAFSLKKLGGSAASASDHRGACRASNRPFHPFSSAKPLE
jgi:hypothetical protein